MCDYIDNKQRVKYWDIAKGIVILLVILGHIENMNPIIIVAIFSFHMPFFFIANAYFIKNYNIKEHLKRSGKTLIFPYFVVCIISAIICVNENISQVPNYIIFFRCIIDMFVGMSKISTRFTSFQSVWLVWFLICLFAAKIIYVALMKKIAKYPLILQLIIMLVLSVIGMLIGLKYAYLPWSLDVSLVALPFMWFEDSLHKYKIIENIRLSMYILCFIVWAMLGVTGFEIEMSMRSYPGYILVLIEAVAGSIIFIGISVFIEKKTEKLSKFLAWCGKNSIIILAIHCFEMRFYDWDVYIFSNIPFVFNCIGVFLVKTVLILLVTWIIVQLKDFKHYVDEVELTITCNDRV